MTEQWKYKDKLVVVGLREHTTRYVLPPAFFSAVLNSAVTYPPTPEEMRFWKGKAPEKIVIATGSGRKDHQWVLLNAPIVLPHPTENYEGDRPYAAGTEPIAPGEFYRSYLGPEVPNGDGHTRGHRYLDYWMGVPVCAEFMEGEGSDNEPTSEATNKVIPLAKEYLKRNAIIVATDAVDGPQSNILSAEDPSTHPNFPHSSDGDEQEMFTYTFFAMQKAVSGVNQRPGGGYFLGKPMNLPEYKALDRYGAEGEAKRVLFLRYYAQILNVSDTVFVHTNGIAAVNTADVRVLLEREPDLEIETAIRRCVVTKKVELVVPHDPSALDTVIADPYVGGGGLTQRFIKWDDTEFLLGIADSETRDALTRMPDLYSQQMLVFFQISGTPRHAMEGLIAERWAAAELMVSNASGRSSR